MLKYFLLSLVVLAVTAKPHRKPSSWHGHGQINHGNGQNNLGHGQNNHGHGHDNHGHGNNYHGHGNNHNGSNTHSGSVHQFINSPSCGEPHNSPLIPFIVGGEQAQPHSWPWMVSVQVSGHMCGGSLITDQHIVTAAHCSQYSAGSYRVWLGKHNIRTTENTEIMRRVDSIRIHENYDSSSLENDIAIMKLRSPVVFTNEISTVCISLKEVADGQDCMTTGWGYTKEGGTISSTLNQVHVPIIDTTTCSHYYGVNIPKNSMVCAGKYEGGKDSCQGDSGGPLVYKENDKWHLAGITSWGYGCARRGYPGVYARVDTYAKWIETAVTNM